MEPLGKQSAMDAKLNTLLRMGLVSRNNYTRAKALFKNPDLAKSMGYRSLMQEILVDVMDRIVNNRTLFNAVRASISKEPATVVEGTGEERTKTLLRSGLVKKKDVIAARRALKSPATAKGMSASRVYREMMIDMLDSMVKKITGSPVLFNAFKNTLGKEAVEESFEQPNEDTLAEMMLHEEAVELLEKNKPTKPDLWARAKAKARAKFDVYPSAYANGWAVKWYNEHGGGWRSVNEGKTFFDFSKDLNEGSAVPSRKEAMAAIRWGKKAMKNPAKHNISREDIAANMKVAKDTLRPLGKKESRK